MSHHHAEQLFWVIYHGYSLLLSAHRIVFDFNLHHPHPPFTHGFAQAFHQWVLAREHHRKFRILAWDGNTPSWANFEYPIHIRRICGNLWGAFTIHAHHHIAYLYKARVA